MNLAFLILGEYSLDSKRQKKPPRRDKTDHCLNDTAERSSPRLSHRAVSETPRPKQVGRGRFQFCFKSVFGIYYRLHADGVWQSNLLRPSLVPINEQLVDQTVREIVLAPRAVVTVVDP